MTDELQTHSIGMDKPEERTMPPCQPRQSVHLELTYPSSDMTIQIDSLCLKTIMAMKTPLALLTN